RPPPSLHDALPILQDVERLIPSVLDRHINRIRLIDMPFPERLHITALRAEAKRINRVLERPAVRALNLPSGGKDHLSRLHTAARSNRTVRLHNTAEPHMRAVSDLRIMIH